MTKVRDNYTGESGNYTILFEDGSKAVNVRGEWITTGFNENKENMSEFQKELYKELKQAENKQEEFKILGSREAMMYYSGFAKGIATALSIAVKMREGNNNRKI